MANTAYDRYLEAEVLGADPLKLVWLLCRGAIDASRSARACLEQGNIRGRVHQINRAWSIVAELAASLDHSQGAGLSRRLASLYSYLQTRLIEANVKQSAEPLLEVESLLTTLADAWHAAHLASCQPAATSDREYEAAALTAG
jgi:flagellar secretion chaperone FliS